MTIAAVFLVAAIPASAAAEWGHGGGSSDWSGVYVGVHGGHAWASSDTTAIGSQIQTIVTNLNDPDAYDASPSGLFGGVQVGANAQMDNIVFGLEANVSYGDISETIADPATSTPGPQTITTEIDWHGSVRGRIGLDAGGTLFYGTGGVAWAHATTSITEGIPTDSESSTLTGWVAGLGLEHMVSEKVSFRGEYLYTDFATHRLYEDIGGGEFATDADGRMHSISAGLNYHF